ncbi:MAG: metalloregulator ArsR/SmtB family transcription factor [Alphaproteobacteria bacterium]
MLKQPALSRPTRRRHKESGIDDATKLLRLLSHPVRLSILCNLLHNGPMQVNALVRAERGRAGQSQVSQFLGKMRREGLVESKKKGLAVTYSIKSAPARKIISTLYTLYCK